MSRGSFAFSKWYIDCLDSRGGLVMLYWTSLEWRRLRINWHSFTHCPPGAPARTRSSVAACAPPALTATSVRWSASRLRCEATLESGVPGIATQELAPGVFWTCAASAAHATVRLGAELLHGTGYAEHVALRVPPWKLGIHRLQWGRWISTDAARSVVWIEWTGAANRRWVFLDGRVTNDARIDERSIAAGATTLALGQPSVVIDRRVGGVIGRIPALRAVAPSWLLGAREVRHTRAGTLSHHGTATPGTAVDEVVDFG